MTEHDHGASKAGPRRLRSAPAPPSPAFQSEAAATALLNAPSDAVYMIDREGTLVATNRAGAERLARPAHELVGSRVFDLFPAEIATRREQLVKEVFRTGLPVRFEDEREGRTLDNTYYPITDDRGEVTACAVYARDVTERRRAEEQARRRALELSALLDTSRALAATLDYDQIVEVAARKAAEALDVPQCSLWELDANGSELVFTHLYQRRRPAAGPLPKLEGIRFPLADCPHEAAALRSGQALRHAATDHELPAALRALILSLKRNTWLMVPLVQQHRMLGALLLVDPQAERRFSKDEVALAQGIAEQVAAALVNARLHRMIEQQAATDGLTGLFNHRYFYTLLDDEVARAARYRYPVSVLMIDLDDFKEVNDACGHLAGDEVLRAVAMMLSSTTRHGADVVARYGGEEFAVLLPNTRARPSADPKGALATAERMRRAVADIDIDALAGAGGCPGRHLTASIGVAVYPDTAGDLRELVRQADAALYEAKRRGKNTVVCAG